MSSSRPRGDRHGPLAPLLLVLTVVTGLVDAFSYLVLGHVFVANMTGNVVFLAFALVGATGFSLRGLAGGVGSLRRRRHGAAAGWSATSGRRRGRMLAVSTGVSAWRVGAALRGDV